VKAKSFLEAFYERMLRSQCTHIPYHIAIIQDGNRRFAKNRGVETAAGHRLGADTTEKVLEWARELGIRHITLYSFSTENFKRGAEEIQELFALFAEKFERVVSDTRVHRHQIRVRVFGDRRLLPHDLLQTIERAERATRSYDRFYLNIALAYGGRNEIVHAARAILQGVRAGAIRSDEITKDLVERHLNDGDTLPPVDLIIRTGNEFRTSNFLPWLANGNESAVYFCAPYWPEFRRLDLLRAIRVYDQRVRGK
jgi:tritrans,polycis-undecaprenyl-diphosphate synthase [geranylgeranyl-diphosphate specific]